MTRQERRVGFTKTPFRKNRERRVSRDNRLDRYRGVKVTLKGAERGARMIEDRRIISLEISRERGSFVLRAPTLSEDRVHPQKRRNEVTLWRNVRLNYSKMLFNERLIWIILHIFISKAFNIKYIKIHILNILNIELPDWMTIRMDTYFIRKTG